MVWYRLPFGILGGVSLCLGLCAEAYAQALPGPADAGRVKPVPQLALPEQGREEIAIPEAPSPVEAPQAAKNIHFTLRRIVIKGATAFDEKALADLYAPYLGKDISLDVIWRIAGAITERYRAQGYFLSRAYVPPQQIEDGAVTIKVAEGYIGEVKLTDPQAGNRIIRRMITHLTRQKPLTIGAVESFLLRLNDLPGMSYRAILEPLEGRGGQDGAVRLALSPQKKPDQASLAFNDDGSRFLGPYQASASYRTSLLPLQQTTLSTLASTPMDELKYGALSHEVKIYPSLVLKLDGEATASRPGARLKPNDIQSRSADVGVTLQYQAIRQRKENLMAHAGLDGRNTESDTFGTTLTRDRTRALRAGITYDTADRWDGYDVVDLTLSQGLAILGSSRKGDRNLSRAQAGPDFRKAELTLTRQQALGAEWALIASATGQLADGALYSSEEFGYGGQAFGRAYDASEITGDDGIAGAVELRYLGFTLAESVRLAPYAFYDIGKIWNIDPGQEKQASGSSAGVGIRLDLPWGLSANLGLAQPLTRAIATPLYGNGKSPRLLLEVHWAWPG